jgi:magnesium transporter
MRYLINKELQEVADDTPIKPQDEILEILDEDQARKHSKNLCYRKELIRTLDETISYCKIEMLPKAVIGTLLIPDKQTPLTSTISVQFYLESKHLIIIDDAKHLAETKALLLDKSFALMGDSYRFFFEFLESLINGDTVFLQNYEKRLATMEESMSDMLPRELSMDVTRDRRELLMYHSYYQQLMDMFEILSENITQFFPDEYSSQFQRLLGRVDRLYDNTQMLREYAHQIREMQQSQIDLHQNDTMRILTVVTTIFFPLSLITGWYGMNFKNMPEIHHPFGYFILIIVCVVIVLGEIIYFKKKGWL